MVYNVALLHFRTNCRISCFCRDLRTLTVFGTTNFHFQNKTSYVCTLLTLPSQHLKTPDRIKPFQINQYVLLNN